MLTTGFPGKTISPARVLAVAIAVFIAFVPSIHAYESPSFGVSASRHERLGLGEGIWLASTDRERREVAFDRLHGRIVLVVIAADRFQGRESATYIEGNIARAERVRAALESHFRIDETLILKDSAATAGGIRDLFSRRLPDLSRSDDLVIVYLALPARPGPDGIPTIFPHDGFWPRKGSLGLDEFFEFSRALPSRDAIFLFDICAGEKVAWTPGRTRFTPPWKELEYLRRVAAIRNRLFLVASDACPDRGEEQPVQDLFSILLTEEISKDRGYFVASRLFTELARRAQIEASALASPLRPQWSVLEGEDIVLVQDLDRRVSTIRSRIDGLKREIAANKAWLQGPYARVEEAGARRAARRVEELEAEMARLWREMSDWERKRDRRIEILERYRLIGSSPFKP